MPEDHFEGFQLQFAVWHVGDSLLCFLSQIDELLGIHLDLPLWLLDCRSNLMSPPDGLELSCPAEAD
ncbi:MAG: hypothetical protein A2W00_01020 [Candidatus Eisenbacteria bacterium RBG_16_71_46]|nr:MAG: hypothetical protein A2W00_01020 [Candidatus Eisenbacteria bacterium RBG_16_71_46]